MSEISFKSIYDGVSLALHAAFPAVQVHGGNVKQGLNPGDLNVVMPSAGQSKQVGERFLRTPTLDVTSSIAPTANGPLRRASCMCW